MPISFATVERDKVSVQILSVRAFARISRELEGEALLEDKAKRKLFQSSYEACTYSRH